MQTAYSQNYLYDAMRNMGEMIEYADEVCHEPMDDFLRFFVMSGLAAHWEAGDPRVLCARSGTELHHDIMWRVGIRRETWESPMTRYDTGAAYWVGFMLAYYQWRSRRRFEEVIGVFAYADMMRFYPALHTASEEKWVVEIEREYDRRRGTVTRLQEYRRRLGMTQRELAETSGVNLRTLQQYEIGSKDIKRASMENVIRLSETLCCEPKDLI